MNTFGYYFRVTTFGESHGTALGAVIDGCPAGLTITQNDFQKDLNRRKPGQSSITSPRQESDHAEILSGIFENQTLGTPIAVIVRNHDAKSEDYNDLKNVFRPGHADEAWYQKYEHRDYRGGGRSSGRETIGRVIGGTIAKKIIQTIAKTKIIAHVIALGNIETSQCDYEEIKNNPVRCADSSAAKKMITAIIKAKKEKNSLGGILRIEIHNPPSLLGEPVFHKTQARLAEALMSLGAVRGFTFGSGFSASSMNGFEMNKLREGISGGITTGDKIIIDIAVKPTPTIGLKQQANTIDGDLIDLEIQGRHDPVILPRLAPIAESMVAMVLADLILAPPSQI